MPGFQHQAPALLSTLLQVRLVSTLPWLVESSVVTCLQWTAASAALVAVVADTRASSAVGVYVRSCHLELLSLGDSAAYIVTNPDGTHMHSLALPGADAEPRVRLSASAIRAYEASCPFVSGLPGLPDLHSAIAEGKVRLPIHVQEHVFCSISAPAAISAPPLSTSSCVYAYGFPGTECH